MSPIRWLTLESGQLKETPFGRAVLRLSRPDVRYPLEDSLEAAVAERRKSKDLLNFYRSFAFTSSVNGSSLNKYVWTASADGSMSNYSDRETIPAALDRFRQETSRSSFPGLRIYALNLGSTDEHSLKLYGFPAQARFVITLKSDKAVKAIPNLLYFLLRGHWNLEVPSIIRPGSRPNPRMWSRQLPSAAVVKPRGRSSLLDLEEETTIHLRWLRRPPTFNGDVAGYIQQEFAEFPRMQGVYVIIPRANSPDERVAVMFTSSSDFLQRLKDSYSLKRIPATSGSMEQLFRYFAFVSRQIRDDVCHFIAQSMRELSAVDLKGRGRPSEFKVKFLLHLRECHTELSKECTTDLKILNIIIEAIQLPADWYDRGLYDVQVDLESDARDLEYLAKELLSTTKYIDEVKDRIKELMELSEKRRTVVVTFLVALFVPMAFVSNNLAKSIFGMNIKDASVSSYWTNTTTIEDTQTSASGSSVQTTTDQEGNQVWPFRLFWIVAIPLTFATIVLPLVAGAIFRSIAKFSYRHRIWWRAIVGLVACFGVGGTLGFLQMIGYVLNIPLAIIGLLFTLIHLWTAFRLKRIAMFITWVVMGVVIGLMTMLYTQSIVGLSLIWAFGWVFLVAVWVFKPDFMYSPARYKRELDKKREENKQLGSEIDT